MKTRSASLSRGLRPAGHGFTLIEMAVVMAMIGLLLTLAVPHYFKALEHGRLRVQQENIASMRDSIDKFFGDQGRYPDTLDELVQKRYLRSVPLDPVTGKPDWTVIAPADATMGAVYDVQSAAREAGAEPPAASGAAAGGAAQPMMQVHATSR